MRRAALGGVACLHTLTCPWSVEGVPRRVGHGQAGAQHPQGSSVTLSWAVGHLRRGASGVPLGHWPVSLPFLWASGTERKPSTQAHAGHSRACISGTSCLSLPGLRVGTRPHSPPPAPHGAPGTLRGEIRGCHQAGTSPATPASPGYLQLQLAGTQTWVSLLKIIMWSGQKQPSVMGPASGRALQGGRVGCGPAPRGRGALAREGQVLEWGHRVALGSVGPRWGEGGAGTYMKLELSFPWQ